MPECDREATKVKRPWPTWRRCAMEKKNPRKTKTSLEQSGFNLRETGRSRVTVVSEVYEG